MVRYGGSSAGSYLADPTSPIPSHCASIVVTSTLRANKLKLYTTVASHQMIIVRLWLPGTPVELEHFTVLKVISCHTPSEVIK